MADKIFGQGLRAVPLTLVQAPAVVPEFEAAPRPVYINNLGNIEATQGAAVADATEADVVETVNELLASLRAAGVIAS